MDIPEGRWIDIRLHEEPEPEPEIFQTETPVDFQPTNLSEAVAAAMAGGASGNLRHRRNTLITRLKAGFYCLNFGEP